MERDPVLSENIMSVAITTTDIDETSKRPKISQTETAELSPAAAALIQIRETALVVARLADEQLALTTRLDKAAVVISIIPLIAHSKLRRFQ